MRPQSHPPKSETRIARAARLVILLELDRAGYLETHSLQEIADALGQDNHRSTIMRDLRTLSDVKAALQEARARLSL